MIAWKFVKWDVKPLEELKDSKVYMLKVKVMNGGKLTREEKNWLFNQLRGGAYYRRQVCLLGWAFDFSEVLKTYYVKFEWGDIEEVFAPDKTSIREHFGAHNIVKIIEV